MQLSFENHLEVSTGSEVVLSGITNMQNEWVCTDSFSLPSLLFYTSLPSVFLIIPSFLCPPSPFLPKSIKFAVIFKFKDC